MENFLNLCILLLKELSLFVWVWPHQKAFRRKRVTGLINELMTKVFIEQPLALPESALLIADLPDKIPTLGKMNQIF